MTTRLYVLVLLALSLAAYAGYRYGRTRGDFILPAVVIQMESPLQPQAVIYFGEPEIVIRDYDVLLRKKKDDPITLSCLSVMKMPDGTDFIGPNLSSPECFPKGPR